MKARGSPHRSLCLGTRARWPLLTCRSPRWARVPKVFFILSILFLPAQCPSLKQTPEGPWSGRRCYEARIQGPGGEEGPWGREPRPTAPHTPGTVTFEDSSPLHTSPFLPCQPTLPKVPGPPFSQAPSHCQTLSSVPRCSLTLLGPSCQPHVPGFPGLVKVLMRPQWEAPAQPDAAFTQATGPWAGLWTPQQV